MLVLLGVGVGGGEGGVGGLTRENRGGSAQHATRATPTQITDGVGGARVVVDDVLKISNAMSGMKKREFWFLACELGVSLGISRHF